jgi:acyl carrier protein
MIDQKKIIEAIADSLTIPATDIDPEKSLQDDYNLNRIEIGELFSSLAREFDVVFIPGETDGVDTVADLIALIEDKLLE